MLDLHAPSVHPAEEAVVVIADDAERVPPAVQPQHETHDVEDPVSAIDEISDEHETGTLSLRSGRDVRIEELLVSESDEELLELIVAAMNVADDVELVNVEVVVNARVGQRRRKRRRAVAMIGL
jgi:hypothetical protein